MSTAQALQADKLALIEKNKNDMLSVVKATAAKLKFTLNGSVARDREYQQMALSSAKERLVNMEAVLVDVESVFRRVGNDPIDINVSGNFVNWMTSSIYCITLYFRGKKISRKWDLKYFREKIFSRIYCPRENIFPRK